jgi:tight adherence protein B
MSALLPALVILGLTVLACGALFGALMMTRNVRIALQRRVNLVRTAELTPFRDPMAATVLNKASSSTAARVRRLFTLGNAQRWGMRMNGMAVLTMAGAGGGAGWLLTHTLLQFSYAVTIPATIGGFLLAPRTVLMRQQHGTEQQFITLLPDTIDMVIRMLRAGLPVSAAARAVGEEAPAPVNAVFKAIADRGDIGVPFETALSEAAESVGLADFRFFAVAVALQLETGGKLAVTLDILGDIMRKRAAVRLRAKAATGEIRMSAGILGVLPFFVTGALLLVSPSYLAPLASDPRGHVIIAAIIAGLTLAYVTMRRMLRSVTVA